MIHVNREGSLKSSAGYGGCKTPEIGAETACANTRTNDPPHAEHSTPIAKTYKISSYN